MNESKCQLIYIAFWSRYCALFAQKLAYSYCRHWKWCIFSGLKSSVNFLIAAFNSFAVHVPVKLIYLYFILSSLFYFKEIKNGPYQPWLTWQLNSLIILAVKILGWFLLKWAGFGELLGWKSSTRSGNTAVVSYFSKYSKRTCIMQLTSSGLNKHKAKTYGFVFIVHFPHAGTVVSVLIWINQFRL